MSDVFESFADLDDLAQELRSDDAERRRVAVLEIEDSGSPAAIPLLASLVDDPDSGVRRQAAIALGSFDGAMLPQLSSGRSWMKVLRLHPPQPKASPD